MFCEDYPCCGHTPADPCAGDGPTSQDYLTAWAKRGSADPDFDPYDDYYGGY